MKRYAVAIVDQEGSCSLEEVLANDRREAFLNHPQITKSGDLHLYPDSIEGIIDEMNGMGWAIKIIEISPLP